MNGPPELLWLWPGLAVLGVGAIAAFSDSLRRRVFLLLWIALALIAAAIASRWIRLEHGPFYNMYEILTSSLFSLGAIYGIACWRLAWLRGSAPIVLPLLAVMAAWTLVVSPIDSHAMPTYETPWLWVHLAMGKFFLGLLLLSLACALALLLRPLGAKFSGLPENALLEISMWHFLVWALVFDTAMLVAGAAWAQDAWGRYWDWDPLETWAFLTWLLAAGALHARFALRVSPRLGALLVTGVFVLAFLTFFGVPFISQAPHKGAV